MMNEYVRKQDAIDDLHTQLMYRMGSDDMKRRLDDWVKTLPAADVVQVVHGKWIPHSEKSREYIGTVLVHVMYDYWLCDTCGYRVKNGQPMYNFCPNCGADMRGEQNCHDKSICCEDETGLCN